MISKAIRGSGFSGCISYTCSKAEAIQMQNLVASDWKKTASEMRAVADLNTTRKAVYHHILSFDPTERVTDEQMFQAAALMLKKLGLEQHQAVFAVHRDRDHLHVHTVVNLVNFDGKVVKLSHDFRARPVFAREIKNELGLKAFEQKQRGPNARFPDEKIAAIQAAARTGSRADLEKVLRELGVTMEEKSSRQKAVTYRFTDLESGAYIAGSKIDPSLSSPTTVKEKERARDGLWQRYSEAKAEHPTQDEKTQKARLDALKKRHQSERKSIRDEQFAIRKEMLTDARRLRLPQPDHDAIKAVSAARLAKALEVLEIRHREERKVAAARFPTFREWLRTQSVTDLSAAVRLSEMGEPQPETVATLDGLEFTISSDGTVDFKDEQGRLLFTSTQQGVRFVQHDDPALRERAIVAGLRVESAHGRNFTFGSDPRVREEIIDIAGRNSLRLPGLTPDEEERWKQARNTKPAALAPTPAAVPLKQAAAAQTWQQSWTDDIRRAVGASTSNLEFAQFLKQAGITAEEVTRANGVKGLAFLKEGVRVTGSSLDRDLSWSSISKTLDHNRHRQMVDRIDDEETARDIAEIRRKKAQTFFGRIATAARMREPLILAATATLSSRNRRRHFTPTPGAKALSLADIEREIMSLFRSPSRPRLHSMDLVKQIHEWASKGLLVAQANLAQQQKETMNVGRSNDGR